MWPLWFWRAEVVLTPLSKQYQSRVRGSVCDPLNGDAKGKFRASSTAISALYPLRLLDRAGPE
jgi:hypothetical protein